MDGNWPLVVIYVIYLATESNTVDKGSIVHIVNFPLILK